MAPSNDCLLVVPDNATFPNRIHEEFYPGQAIVNRTSPFVSVRVAVTTFLAGGVLIACISRLNGWSIADGLIIYSALGLPLLIACISSRVIQSRQAKHRSISLADDVITFSTADETETCPAK